MPRQRLFGQLYASFLAVTLVFVGAVIWYSSHAFTAFYFQHQESELRSKACIMEDLLPPSLSAGDQPAIDSLCKRIYRKTATRFTVVLPSGKVIGDSERNPDSMENHADRQEVRAALGGRNGQSIRFSSTLRERMMYVAVLHVRSGTPVAVIRAAVPLTAVSKALSRLYGTIALMGLLVAVIAAIASYWTSRRISGPILQLKDGVRKFANGDLQSRLPALGGGEIGELSSAMNDMASQLHDRIETVTRQRNEQQAILSSMIEGVIAVDRGGKILSVNDAAAHILDLRAGGIAGKWVNEVIRSSDICRFIADAAESELPLERDIVLPGAGGDDLYLQAHGASLRDAQNQPFGALAVLNDVTRLKKLENIRRDFVSNVSHELKTPLTSIKGFVETILDGAINDRGETQRFLEIAKTQIDRLNAIVDDLLNLSRIEQNAEQQDLSLESAHIAGIVESAVTACARTIDAKKMSVSVHCDDGIRADVNLSLIEQALINLIDNAVKYSDEKGAIEISAAAGEKAIDISVADHGMGIASEHLPRLFERFYRVDKARSRKMGGTGLGLSIVKHIMRAHGGTVSVESTLGEGSTFTLHLPKGKENSVS